MGLSNFLQIYKKSPNHTNPAKFPSPSSWSKTFDHEDKINEGRTTGVQPSRRFRCLNQKLYVSPIEGMKAWSL